MKHWQPSYAVCATVAAAFLFIYPVRAYDLYPSTTFPQADAQPAPVLTQSLKKSTLDVFQPISGQIAVFIDSLRRLSDQGIPITQKFISNSAGISSGSFSAAFNNWLRQTIGIDIHGIVRAVGGFFIWIITAIVSVLNFLSNLIRTGMSHL